MLPAGLITAVIALVVLGFQIRGYRLLERTIGALLLIVMGGFGYELLRIGPSPSSTATGLLPLPVDGGVFLAVGIVGATVMPHMIYLHSALTSRRVRVTDDTERLKALRFERWDVIVALGLAGIINLAMLTVAAKLFHDSGNVGISTIEDAHTGIARLAGGTAALVFAAALLASGISSSSVGTLAGQAVMAGFVKLSIPPVARRAITMLPSIAVLAAGLNTTSVLNISQVALSFGIPFALVPLVAVTGDRRVMGTFVNPRWVNTIMIAIVAVIIGLNAALLVTQVIGG
jgi:manganese transport protein